jgi:enoyl-CoA hydratase
LRPPNGKDLLVIRHEHVGTERRVSLITLDRQDRRNAMDPAHWEQLTTAVSSAVDAGARAIVITGAGKVFCAGADLAEVAGGSMVESMETTFLTVREAPVPVLAYLNGPAVGAGLQLIVTCDLRMASPGARLNIPAVEIGLPTHPGTIARLIALGGVGAARALLIGGERMPAERAYGLGLVDRIGELEDALAWATEMSTFAPLPMRWLKQRLQIDDPPDGSEYPAVAHEFMQTEDFAEAGAARKERRPPHYVGR